MLLFALCFIGVHVLRLARIGQAYRKTLEKDEQPDKPKPEPPTKPSTPPQNEPVYYLVERKKRVKSTLSEPKRIHFK